MWWCHMTSVNEFHERSPREMFGQNFTSLPGVEGVKTKVFRKYRFSHRENLKFLVIFWLFCTMDHYGIEEVERHFLWKFLKKFKGNSFWVILAGWWFSNSFPHTSLWRFWSSNVWKKWKERNAWKKWITWHWLDQRSRDWQTNRNEGAEGARGICDWRENASDEQR